MITKKILDISIPIKPFGKGRPRFSRRSGTTYTPENTRRNEAYVSLYAAKAMAGKEMTKGPVIVRMTAYFKIPGRNTKAQNNAIRAICMAHDKKPDIDNIFKGVLDSLNNIVWLDDKQVCSATIRKRYTDGGERIHVSVIEIAADK